MIWKILLILFVLFVIITLIRAGFFKPTAAELEKAKIEDVDIDELEVAKHISGAIKCKTVSKPNDEGVEWEEFEKLHKILDDYYPLIVKTLTKEVVGKASLVYCWKGKNPKLKPIAMLAHQDVAPVSEGTEKDWKFDAFSGEIADGYIWGRGALDMKNHLICVMEAVESLIKEGFQPERDVYLCFGHNEETVYPCSSGARLIAEHLKAKGVHFDSVLDEGSALIRLDVNGLIHTYIAAIGVAEKGYADIKITTHDKGGHTSAAPKHSGMAKLANMIKDLENHQFKSRWMPFLTEFVTTVGKHSSYLGRVLVCNFPIFKPLVKFIFTQIPGSASMVRTITSVSMCEGSSAANVLPQRPSITANFRMLQGETIDDVIDHVHKVIRYDDIEVECLTTKDATKMSSTDSRSFKAIRMIENGLHPNDVAVAPYLVIGGTDAFYYEEMSDTVLRYAPFNVSLELFFKTHGTNECCPVSTLKESVTFFREYIKIVSDKE